MKVAAVGAGGFFGAMMRFLIGKMTPTPLGFPYGTLLINLLGCLFLAWFFTITANRWKIHEHLKLAIGTGFTGAFTTFSTFSVETLTLLKNQQYVAALLYVLISIFGGIIFALIGAKVGSVRVQSEGGVK